MFVGRKEELREMERAFSFDHGAIMVYGKRRVGKTTLITEALRRTQKKYIYYECTKSMMQDNVNSFVHEAVEADLLPAFATYPSFLEVFQAIDRSGEKAIIVIDEYPYLKTKADSETIDSIFQKTIDVSLKNTVLVLSGSHTQMMLTMLEEGNALYGRFNLILHIKELSYLEASEFYPRKTPREKIAFYSVFGGSPLVNSMLDETKDLEENICATILNPRSIVYMYASQMLLSDISEKLNADAILRAIGNGKKRYKDIQNFTMIPANGNLNKNLRLLTDMEIIGKKVPINRMDDAKKTLYETNDNLLRFYYTYVHPNRSAFAILSPKAFYKRFIEESLWRTFIPLRTEGIARDFLSKLVKDGRLDDVEDIGSYWYDDKENRTNGEFDVAVRHFGGDYSIFEVKNLESPLDDSVMKKELAQVQRIRELRIREVGFISVSGFLSSAPGEGLRFSGEDLYAF